MTPERWQRIEDLFHAAREFSPDERAAFLQRECDGDATLGAEVEGLLCCDTEAGSFIETEALDVVACLVARERVQAMLGKRIGQYRVERLLGAGGMGEVYLAEDTRLNRPVALKLLHPQLTGDDARVERLLKEAQTASALNHPNIVTVYGVEQSDDRVQLMATEYVEGQTLRRRMCEGKMSVAEAVAVAVQVARALVAAHEAGFIHRDIKPENIMVRPDGIVKVLDFGIAKLAESRSLPFPNSGTGATTEQGVVAGTVHYMSPEQLRRLKTDARTDIWSLGCVLYEMLAARAPFAGETASDVVVHVLDREPPSLAELAPNATPALQKIVRRALEKSPEERYQTAREMLDDLEQLQRDGVASRRARKYAGFVGERGARRAVALSALVVLLFVLVAVYFPHRASRTINSMAVLPFVNAGGDPNSEYISDGITESLINNLSQLPNLKVIARSSVFRYKVRDPQSDAPDPQEAARALGVQAVLTGRVVQTGDELRVSAELVSAEDNSHMWGEQYNRKLSDVFGVQEEISRDISQQLRLRLTGEASEEMTRRRTDSLKAFEFYTRGRSYIHRRTREDLEIAARFYEQAIAEDPNYALAYAGLAEAYGNLGVRGYIPPAEGRRRLGEAARRASSLDPNLAEAHVAMGYSLMGFAPYDFPDAERELRRAIELSPSLAIAHLYLALTFLREGRLDEGLREMVTARELDPLSAIIARQVALHYLLKRDYARALQVLRQANELGPAFTTTTEVGIYIQNRLYDEALAGLDAAKRERHDDPILIYSTGFVYAAAGRRREAVEVVRQLERLSAADSSQAEWIAKIYAALGEREQAFTWLERGLGTGAIGAFYKDEPVWDSLRDDPRFADLLRQMGIPQ
ncbi:MAG: eukaryotic-like serine/threonine-protein kinase [Acidobacteriota bacterium]|jgi:serine/threonine-protein kinase|nr:eukaryotic-like serine/threonine-protein kinase [Acidobacteriota bacterium]